MAASNIRQSSGVVKMRYFQYLHYTSHLYIMYEEELPYLVSRYMQKVDEDDKQFAVNKFICIDMKKRVFVYSVYQTAQFIELPKYKGYFRLIKAILEKERHYQ